MKGFTDGNSEKNSSRSSGMIKEFIIIVLQSISGSAISQKNCEIVAGKQRKWLDTINIFKNSIIVQNRPKMLLEVEDIFIFTLFT